MTDAVKIALIQFMGTVFAALIAAWAIIYGTRKAAGQVVKSVDGIVTKLTDSKDATIAAQKVTMGVKDERLAATAISSEALGVLKEKERNEAK